MASQKGRYWEIVIYPDSLPSNWLDIIENWALPCAISPLHNKDKFDNGELKKPHYHCLIAFSGPTTKNNIINLIKDLDIKDNDTLELINHQPYIAYYKGDICSAYDYHIHLYNHDKYPYNNEDRILINGFNIDNYKTLTDEEEAFITKSIFNIINENAILEYCDLLNYLYEDNVLLYIYCFKHTIIFNTYLTSYRNKLYKAAKKD